MHCPVYEKGYPELDTIDCYGVCDSPEQFLSQYQDLLKKDARHLVVFFTHIKKNVKNKGMGGGWRWHKWGEYIGEGKPTCEYLDDEELFHDGIYVYHIYSLT